MRGLGLAIGLIVDLAEQVVHGKAAQTVFRWSAVLRSCRQFNERDTIHVHGVAGALLHRDVLAEQLRPSLATVF